MTTTTHAPWFAVGDRVLIRNRGAHEVIWTIEAILPPTRSQPQYGYTIRRPSDRKARTVDQDKLELAIEFLPHPDP
jgi:hypothetical protein